MRRMKNEIVPESYADQRLGKIQFSGEFQVVRVIFQMGYDRGVVGDLEISCL